MGALEKKLLQMLGEQAEWEDLGGPTPTQLPQHIDYAKNVKHAELPKTPIVDPGISSVTEDEEEDDDKEVVTEEEDIGPEPDEDDEDEKEVKEEVGDGDDDEDDVIEVDDDDDDDDDDEDEDDDEEDELDNTFESMIAKLRKEEFGESDEEKDSKECKEEKEDDGDKDEDDEDVVVEDVDCKEVLPQVKKKSDADLVTEEDEESKDDEDEEEEDDEEKVEEGKIPPQFEKFKKKKVEEEAPPSPKDDTLPTVDKKSDADLVTEEDEEDEKDEEDEEKPEVDFKEDVAAMFAGESTLPESFKEKAALVFEAAVRRRVQEERKRIRKAAASVMTENYKALKSAFAKKQNVYESKLTKKVDGYLNFVVEDWMKENRLAVETGLRAELAEDFIKSLKNVFTEHYIEVPESKVDVLKELSKKISVLENKLNEQVNVNVKMRKSLDSYRKETAIRRTSAGLTESQVEKFRKLAEGVEYSSKDEFGKKLVSIKESYFPKTQKKVTKPEVLVEQKKPTSNVQKDPSMESYKTYLAKMQKN